VDETQPFFFGGLSASWDAAKPRTVFFGIVPLDVGDAAEAD
jgi:hypothetical protein